MKKLQENGNRIIKKEDSNILEISLLEFKEILSENESVFVINDLECLPIFARLVQYGIGGKNLQKFTIH